jgi:hypothetical protein
LLALAVGVCVTPRTASADDWTAHASVGVDLGIGSVLTHYTIDARDGGSVLLVSARGSYDIAPDVAVSVLLRNWSLPGDNHATMPGVGARFEPYQGTVGRAYVDAALGVGWTGERTSLAYDVGGGFELDLPAAPGLGLGPFLRFGQVVNPANRGSTDGRAWALGLSGSFHIGRWLAASSAERAHSPNKGGPVHPYVFKLEDSDHDGVSDDADQCPEVPAGRHPDVFRRGCPENDEDSDGVPDSDDVCPATPMGDHPDRARRGCPFEDSDGDGVADFDDHCPEKPGPASKDPATNGCPVAHKAAPMPDQQEAAEDKVPPVLNPTPKRRLSRPPAQ